MECELERLERQAKQVPLGAAIARIVRVVVKMAQMDLCQGGMASVAAYTLMPALTGDEAVAREVMRVLCSPGMRAGEWSRALMVPKPALDPINGKRYYALAPLEFTPFEPTTPCVSRSPIVAAIALTMRAAMTGPFSETQCSEPTRTKNKEANALMLAALVTPGQRECTDHAVLAMSRIMSERSARMIEENEALDYIRWEIARAVCAGSIGPMEVDAFARHVAATIVDGACALRAALLA
jgi:hypothetical protein